MSVLAVFAGLPGSGKTTLARLVARELRATFLRIDSIESAIHSTLMPLQDNPVGYVVAERVAADQLRSGRPVVIDAVNNVQQARDGWTNLAAAEDATLSFVEVICSDPVEHRRRVEERSGEMPGHSVPSWAQVQALRWDPWREPRLVVDNVDGPERHVETVLAHLGEPELP